MYLGGLCIQAECKHQSLWCDLYISWQITIYLIHTRTQVLEVGLCTIEGQYSNSKVFASYQSQRTELLQHHQPKCSPQNRSKSHQCIMIHTILKLAEIISW